MRVHEIPVAEQHRSYWLKYSLTVISVAAVTLLGYIGFVIFLKDLMPAFGIFSLYLLSLAAGIATFFSPCSFPLLPGYLSTYYNTERSEESTQSFRSGLIASLGVVSFTVILGLVIALFGQGVASSFSISSSDPSLLTRLLRTGLGTFLISLGVIQLSNATLHNHLLDALTGRLYSAAASGDKGLYLYGFNYNAAGIGCAGPIAAGLIVFAMGSGGFVNAFMAFLVYSATMSSLMLAVSLLVAKSKTMLLYSLKRSTPKIKKTSSLVLIGVGVFLIYSTLNLEFFVQSFFPK
jgi:cytochrome c-type biogenesis protein